MLHCISMLRRSTAHRPGWSVVNDDSVYEVDDAVGAFQIGPQDFGIHLLPPANIMLLVGIWRKIVIRHSSINREKMTLRGLVYLFSLIGFAARGFFLQLSVRREV